MNPASLIVVYVIVWWLVFFMALPIGVNPEQKPKEGNMKGAPKKSYIKLKMLVTSIITAFLTAGYFYAMENNFFDFLHINPYAQGL